MSSFTARLTLIVVVVIALACVGFTTYIAAKMGFEIYQAYVVSPEWPSANGTVVKSEAVKGCGKGGSSYSLEVSYTFQVAGKNYSNRKIWFGNGYCSGKVGAELMAAEFSSAKSRFVYFDPNDPNKAVLFRGAVENGTISLFLLMSAISMGAFIFGGKMFFDLRREDPPVNIPAMLKRREQLDRSIRVEIEERLRGE